MLEMMGNSVCVWKEFHGLFTLFLVISVIGISDSNYRNAKYLYPLADSTGTAEMANGDARGYDGLGDVTSFDKKPPPDYKSMYFHGTDSSFVKLKVGDQTRIESDWSFAMFIYSTYPPRGTVFDYYYDSVSDSVNGRLVSRLQLILNGPRAFLNIFERERNITIEFENFFRTEEWVQLAIVHSFNSGRITILTSDDREVYTSEDNEFRVGVPMQAEIKLGGAFGTSDPFEGSIACFAIFDRELPESEFNKMKNECKDKNTQDNIIGFGLQKLKKTYACSLPLRGVNGDCIIFKDISCRNDKHIVIKNALFGFRRANYTGCKQTHRDCRKENSGCCTKTRGDEMEHLNPGQINNVTAKCSFGKRCDGLQAHSGSNNEFEQSRFSVIYYVCQPVEQVVSFCGDEPVTASSVSVVFNGNGTEVESRAECVCLLNTTEVANGYRISAPDLRLKTTSTKYDSGVIITELGGQNSLKITKMDHFDLISDSQLQLSFESKPEFVWILIQSRGTTGLPDDVTSQTTDTDTTSSVSSNTSLFASTTLQIDNLTSQINEYSTSETTRMVTPSTKTTPTTITTDNQTGAFVGSEQNSENFPIAAVVIPVVLILLGVVAGLFVWRRWQRRQSESKTPVEYKSHTSPNQQTNTVRNKAYDTTNQNSPIKTANDYIVLDQDNTYTYIDHEEAQSGLGKSNDLEHLENLNCTNFSTSSKNKESPFVKGNKKADTTLSAENDYTRAYDTTNANYSYAVLESQASNKGAAKNSWPKIEHETDNVENHNYFVLEPQNPRAVEHKNDGKPSKQSTDDSSEAHNYFVLEPQNPLGANQKFPQTIKTLQVDTTDMEAAQSHDYFVLEPQKPPAETSIPPKITATRAGGLTETEKAKHQNYHALEPQDTYTSIDPDDVVIQTLPENEYNMIDMKGKATISRDPNYGTLETVDQIGNDIEDSGDYSHIGKSLNKNMDMNEYSHT